MQLDTCHCRIARCHVYVVCCVLCCSVRFQAAASAHTHRADRAAADGCLSCGLPMPFCCQSSVRSLAYAWLMLQSYRAYSPSMNSEKMLSFRHEASNAHYTCSHSAFPLVPPARAVHHRRFQGFVRFAPVSALLCWLLGEMSDAKEALTALLDLLHAEQCSATMGCTTSDCDCSPRCVAHAVFGYLLNPLTQCALTQHAGAQGAMSCRDHSLAAFAAATQLRCVVRLCSAEMCNIVACERCGNQTPSPSTDFCIRL